MPQPGTSVFSAKNIAAVLVLVLAACSDSDIKLPHVFSGNEVPPEVISEPRAVPVPTAPPDRSNWLLLGDVPPKPHDFTPQPTIDAAKAEMERDRDDAQQMQQQYQAAPPVISAVPAQP